MDVQIIRVDGTEETLSLPAASVFTRLERLLSASIFDTVNLHDGRVMLVDDNGHAAGKPVNEKATALYHSVCRPGATHQIVGDVAIALDEDFA